MEYTFPLFLSNVVMKIAWLVILLLPHSSHYVEIISYIMLVMVIFCLTHLNFEGKDWNFENRISNVNSYFYRELDNALALTPKQSFLPHTHQILYCKWQSDFPIKWEVSPNCLEPCSRLNVFSFIGKSLCHLRFKI